MKTDLENFMDTRFLNVKDVQNGDDFLITKVLGRVESFGKVKYQVEITHNGKPKILNLYPIQAQQIAKALGGIDWVGRSVKVSKVSVKGGETLNFSGEQIEVVKM